MREYLLLLVVSLHSNHFTKASLIMMKDDDFEELQMSEGKPRKTPKCYVVLHLTSTRS